LDSGAGLARLSEMLRIEGVFGAMRSSLLAC